MKIYSSDEDPDAEAARRKSEHVLIERQKERERARVAAEVQAAAEAQAAADRAAAKAGLKEQRWRLQASLKDAGQRLEEEYQATYQQLEQEYIVPYCTKWEYRFDDGTSLSTLGILGWEMVAAYSIEDDVRFVLKRQVLPADAYRELLTRTREHVHAVETLKSKIQALDEELEQYK